MHLFHCPQCHREHDEPADGTFALTVVCLECALDAEVRLSLGARDRRAADITLVAA